MCLLTSSREAATTSIREYIICHSLPREQGCKHSRRSELTCKVLPFRCKAVWQPHWADTRAPLSSQKILASYWLNLFTWVACCRCILMEILQLNIQTHIYSGFLCVCVWMISSCCWDGWASAAPTAASCYNFQNPRFTLVCVCVCLCVCVAQKVDGYRHVFPVIFRCMHIRLLMCPQNSTHISQGQTR